MTRSRSHHDVVVVGARCAGAATAMLLARAGLDVVVLDRAALPSDTTSTHGLVRGGVVQLQRWGLLDTVVDSGAPAITSVTLSRHDAGAPPPLRLDVKDRAGVDFLLAPRRSVLDPILLESAVRAGAGLLERTTLRRLVRDRTGRVSGIVTEGPGGTHEFGAHLVVGADGLRSRTAELAGAGTTSAYDPSGVCLYTYVGGVRWSGFEFHLGTDTFAGVFPTHGDVACVWLIRPSRAAGTLLGAGASRRDVWLDTLCREVSGLGERVASGEIREPLRGAVGLPNHVRQAWGPGWALVGDAGYHRDPITSHGITDAFRDAELLAEAVRRSASGETPLDDALRTYELTRNAALADTFRLTRALGSFPSPDRFTELQTELARVLDSEARALASGPGVPAEPTTPELPRTGIHRSETTHV